MTRATEGPPTLPVDGAERKRRPLVTGCLDYFPAALAEVAYVSWVGNQKHNPGEPLHWSREKSGDHADCEARHLVERGGFDEVRLPSGETARVRHSAERAWRALADLQLELEAAGAPVARGARPPDEDDGSGCTLDHPCGVCVEQERALRALDERLDQERGEHETGCTGLCRGCCP